eukprot:7029901-Alexandrium_andersonii.AAC.1
MLVPGIRAGPGTAKIAGRVAFRLGTATSRALEERARSVGPAAQETTQAATPAGAAGAQTRRAAEAEG